jgi:predicted GIY-YIG superfamily endonuclease
MQTINTKYIGVTNTKGSRIKATNSGKGASVTLGYDHALNIDGNHKKAAEALKAKLDWQGRMIGGHTEPGMVWVFEDGEVIA